MNLAVITYILLGIVCQAKQMPQSSKLHDENNRSSQRHLGSQLSSSSKRTGALPQSQSSTYGSGKLYDGRASKSNGRLHETNHRGGYINRSHSGGGTVYSYWPNVEKVSSSQLTQRNIPLKFSKSLNQKSSKGKGSGNLRDRYYYRASKNKDLHSYDLTKTHKSDQEVMGNGIKSGKGYYRGTNKKFTGASKKSFKGYSTSNYYYDSVKGNKYGSSNGYSGRSDKSVKEYYRGTNKKYTGALKKSFKGYSTSNYYYDSVKGNKYGSGNGFSESTKKGGKGYSISSPAYGPSKGYNYGPSETYDYNPGKGFSGSTKKGGKGYSISSPAYGPSKGYKYASK